MGPKGTTRLAIGQERVIIDEREPEPVSGPGFLSLKHLCQFWAFVRQRLCGNVAPIFWLTQVAGKD